MSWQLLLEAVVVGIMTVVIGYIVGKITSHFVKDNLPPECDNWNKNHIMEINLFIIGFLVHILSEFGGLNHWYCRNGNACKKLF